MLNKIAKLCLSVTFLFLIVACEKTKEAPKDITVFVKDDIRIENAWLRAMPQGISNTAGFMVIKNDSDKPLILEDVSLDWARMGMIHESKVVDGMAKMIHQDEIVIDKELAFKPGGLHIMVMGTHKPLDPSKSYNILLHFAGREPLAVPFKVGQAK